MKLIGMQLQRSPNSSLAAQVAAKQAYLQPSRPLEAAQPFQGLVQGIQQQGPAVGVPHHGCGGHASRILWQAPGMPFMHLHGKAGDQPCEK